MTEHPVMNEKEIALTRFLHTTINDYNDSFTILEPLRVFKEKHPEAAEGILGTEKEVLRTLRSIEMSGWIMREYATRYRLTTPHINKEHLEFAKEVVKHITTIPEAHYTILGRVATEIPKGLFGPGGTDYQLKSLFMLKLGVNGFCEMIIPTEDRFQSSNNRMYYIIDENVYCPISESRDE